MYDEVRAALGKAYNPARIHDGKFGAMMEVASVNDVRDLSGRPVLPCAPR
jgi:D-Tyr-tRNAtyr deacylase